MGPNCAKIHLCLYSKKWPYYTDMTIIIKSQLLTFSASLLQNLTFFWCAPGRQVNRSATESLWLKSIWKEHYGKVDFHVSDVGVCKRSHKFTTNFKMSSPKHMDVQVWIVVTLNHICRLFHSVVNILQCTTNTDTVLENHHKW